MWLSYLDALSPGCVVAAPVSPFYPAMVQSKKLNTCLYCCSPHIPPPTAHNGAVPKKLDKQLDITLAAGLGHIVLVSNITYGRWGKSTVRWNECALVAWAYMHALPTEWARNWGRGVCLAAQLLHLAAWGEKSARLFLKESKQSYWLDETADLGNAFILVQTGISCVSDSCWFMRFMPWAENAIVNNQGGVTATGWDVFETECDFANGTSAELSTMCRACWASSRFHPTLQCALLPGCVVG